MNGFIMPNTLGESFSFTEPQFNNFPLCTEPENRRMDIQKSDDRSAIFNDTFGVVNENRTPESFSEDSFLCNSHDTFGKFSENTQKQKTLNSVVMDSDSSAEYEIVSLNNENMTKTMVISTTNDVDSKSSIKCAQESGFVDEIQSTKQDVESTVHKHNVENSVQKVESSVQNVESSIQKVESSVQNIESSVLSMENAVQSEKSSPCELSNRFDKSKIVVQVLNSEQDVESSVQNVRSSVPIAESSPRGLSNGFDKSRVVVQVLTSKPNVEKSVKSDAAVESKVSAPSLSSCSFRDDVFNILVKAKAAYSTTRLHSIKRPFKAGNDEWLNKNRFVKITSQCKSSNQIERLVHNGEDVKNINAGKVTAKGKRPSQGKRFIRKRKSVHRKSSMKMTSRYKSSRRNKRSIQSEKNAVVNKKSLVEETSQYERSNQIVKASKKCSNLQFDFDNGKGKKLSEIDVVANNIRNASPNLLRILHYVLFDSYGPCNNSVLLSQTQENILYFCGYPFEYNSEMYMKKKNCLLRLPFPILFQMYKTVIGKESSNRAEIVAQLVDFFMKPADGKLEANSLEIERVVDKLKDSYEDYANLKALALQEPLPIIPMKKLTEQEIQDLKRQLKINSEQEYNDAGALCDVSNDDVLPPYILKGPGNKLKSFPNLVQRVEQSKSPILITLHYLLYGRYEPVETCRRNILEFSGFLPYQKEFIAQRQTLLDKMGPIELYQLCNILCLQGKFNTRSLKIEKIIKYLSTPSKPLKQRRIPTTCKKKVRSTMQSTVNYEKSCNRVKERATSPKLRGLKNILSTCKKKVHSTMQSTVKYEKPCNRVRECPAGPKLRDFKNISFNIECASPSDLTELNDLLFIKPCDESEIHQRILDFARFDFLVNSMEYHYRKTLMHYMSFCVIKKIAQLLNIENWEKASCQVDLSLSILNFLMEMKLPDTYSQNKLPPKPAVGAKRTGKVKSSETSKSEVPQVHEQETEDRWSLRKRVKSPQDHNSSPDHAYSAVNVPVSLQDQSIRTVKKQAVIHRLSKSTVDDKDNSKESKDALPTSPSPQKPVVNDEDSTPLRALLHHPSDHELQEIITKIIKSDLFTLTMGNLVQKVYDFYPEINISYRENFIKTEARQILSQLRSNAVDTLNSIQCNLSDVI